MSENDFGLCDQGCGKPATQYGQCELFVFEGGCEGAPKDRGFYLPTERDEEEIAAMWRARKT